MTARRRSRRESKHDKKVRKEASKLRRRGWRVKAAILGYPQPKPIGKDKKVPDLEATKAGAIKIIEIETQTSMNTDKEQQSTFRRSAAHRTRTTFQVKIA